MSSSAKKVKTNPANETQLQLLYGDDAITKYWSSSLFNTVYLRHDISDKHSCWKDEDDLDFQNFMNTLRNIAAEYKDREKELSNWSETETINNWVKHVLHALGWTNNCTGVQNPFLEETSFRYDGKTYRTDILIVDHPKEKQYVNQAKGDDKLKEARQSILMPVEVKYWQRLEEYRQGKKEEKGRTDNESDDIARTTTPNEQTIQYMDILKKNWGILTDGAKWRLFNTELSSEDAERYYEFNFSSLFQAMTTEETEADSLEVIEAAKYFYHFFSKFAFYPKNESERPFVDEVLQYSKKYVNKVEEDLKERFVKAMNIACNGLFKSAKSAGQTQDNSSIRNVSESALFNVLFIKSLESRGVLPMTSTDYKKISLSSMIDKIERFDPEKEELLNNRELERAFKKGNGNSFSFKPDGTELHDRIFRLTGVIHKGAASKDNFGFEISGFRESVFSDPEWKLFKTCKISNRDWVKILFELGYAESESLNRKYQQIPYAYFTPRQLGSIYESFLEFKIEKSNEDMVYEKKQWIAADLKSKKYRLADIPKVSKNELFFTPDNEERKATGSYYTPDYVVQYILEKSLSPLLEGCNSKGILNLKICDPAMGSGHFLNGCIKYLAAKYVEKLEAEFKGDLDVSIVECKRQILHNCVYGVDINPRAVKLAKMSLWLESAHAGHELENLEDQFYCGDSISGSFDWESKFSSIFKKGGFDAVVGNPPYRKERESKDLMEQIKDSDYGQKYYEGKMDLWYFFLHRSLDIVKNGNRIGFIVPSYWLKSAGSSKLISRIKSDAGFVCAVDFKKNKIFEDVSGQHMVFVLEKGNTEGVLEFQSFLRNDLKDNEIISQLYGPTNIAPKTSIQRESIFCSDGFIDFESSKFDEILTFLEKKNIKLEDESSAFQVAQGIVEAPDKINAELAKKIKSPELAGKGVFVLTKKELAALELNTEEKKFVKKYLHGEDVSFFSKKEHSHFVLYISNLDNKEILNNKSKYPNLVKHFKLVEKAITSSNGPYGLHRARENTFFTSEKLFCHNMFDAPSFCYSNEEIYVNFAFNVVIKGPSSDYSLKYLLGILNSKVGVFWFNRRSKKRGINNDVGVGVLRNFPIRKLDFNSKLDKKGHDEIVSIVNEVKKSIAENGADNKRTLSLVDKLNKCVYDHYGFSQKMIAALEDADVVPVKFEKAA